MSEAGTSFLPLGARGMPQAPLSARGYLRARLDPVLSYLLLPALFALIAVAFAWMSTDPIPALTPDSVQYLNAAQNLAGGYGFVTSATALETPAPRVSFTDWPPLYPILLSVGVGERPSPDALPAAPLRWARWVNMLALTASFFPLAFLAGVMAGPRGVVPALGFYAVFRPIQLVSSFAWSEGLFLLFALLSWASLVWAMERSASHRIGLRSFVVSGVLTALAASTRYVGLTVAAAGAVAIILRTEGASGRQTARRLLAYLLPATLPIALWLLRNLRVTGHAFGEARAAAGLAPEDVLVGTLRTIAADWVCPHVSSNPSAEKLTMALGLGAFLWLAALALHRYGPQTMESKSERLTVSVVMMSFVLIYVVVLDISAGMISYDPLNWRLFAPAYPAILLLCAGLLRGAYVDWRTGKWQRRGFLASCAIMLILNALATTHWVLGPREDRSLSWPYWRSVSLATPSTQLGAAVAAAQSTPPGAVIVTNVWETVALHAGRPVKPVPGRTETGAMERVLSHQGAYVLAEEGFRPDRLGFDDFEAVAVSGNRLERMGTWQGVHLYRISDVPHD